MNWPEWVANFLGTGGAQRTETVQVAAPAADQGAADAAYREGVIAFDVRDYPAALRCFATAVHLRHDDADAHNYLGLTYLKQEHYEDAADCFAMAAHFRPAFADAYYNLALATQRRGEPAAAARYLEQALALRPDYPEAHNALGAAALELGDATRAATEFERVLALSPDDAQAHSNLGYVLFRDLGDYERGAAHIKTALDLNPGGANAWCNYTMVLSHQGRLEEAISVCDQLLAAKPELHEARLNRALAKLKQGRFAEAWPDYEARKLTRSNFVPRALPLPEWRGQPLRDKKLLVYAEQGLGDQIMFGSCLPDLLPQISGCVIECAPWLVPIFKRSFPAARIEPQAHDDAELAGLVVAARFDYQVAIGSLPGHFRRSCSDFPGHNGYLRADPARVAYWKNRLSALGAGLKVGLSWFGGAASTRREARSTQLDEWLPVLSQTSCRFVSLQYGKTHNELEEMARKHGVTIQSWREAIEDYDETAALVHALDLVISVQTAIVHLAGAMGKSAWVIVPANAEWRYLTDGPTMPWYPSMRLFRQQQPGAWAATLASVASELEALSKV